MLKIEGCEQLTSEIKRREMTPRCQQRWSKKL